MRVYSNVCKAILIVLIGVSFVWILFDQEKSEEIERQPQGYHPSIFFEEKTFFDQVLRSDKEETVGATVSGGVIPHHLLATDIISEFFSSIPSDQSVERVVLIGPNHYERGETVFITSRYGWNTPVGDVLPDISLINKLESATLSLEVNEPMMEQEHSMGAIMPFIAHYLPEAYVLPIVISRRADLSDVKGLAEFFEEVDIKKTIFVSSVDFSHYLSSAEAEENDKKVLDVLRRGDLKVLLKLNEDYTDSPESLALLLLLMEQQGIFSFEVKDHKNSADYTNKPEAETTSYYSLVFTR